MRITNKKTITLLICCVLFTLSTGCTNWKAEYDKLYVVNQNLEGRLKQKDEEQKQLSDRIYQDQETIDELRRQIEENSKTPAQASGFEGFDVDFNAAAGTITVTLPNSILFDSGQADLKKTSSAELNTIYSVLRQKYAGRQIDVVGHTDTDPIRKSEWKDNWELSAQRALTVTRYLEEKGIPEKEVRAVACGESRPIASNDTAANKAKNRRVEIVVHMR
jgi:chemotaxis protein MotB